MAKSACLTREIRRSGKDIMGFVRECPKGLLSILVLFFPVLLWGISMAITGKVIPLVNSDTSNAVSIGILTGFALMCTLVSTMWMVVIGSPIVDCYIYPKPEKPVRFLEEVKKEWARAISELKELVINLPKILLASIVLAIPVIIIVAIGVITGFKVTGTDPNSVTLNFAILVGTGIIEVVWISLLGIPIIECYIAPTQKKNAES